MEGKWIRAKQEFGTVAPLFFKDFMVNGIVTKATLRITALGVYEAKLNGGRVGDFYLAPGWTVYTKRLQVQEYDVTDQISQNKNTLEVTVGKGWYKSYMPGWIDEEGKKKLDALPTGLIAELKTEYADGKSQTVITDQSWKVKESPIRFNEIYHGEIYDVTKVVNDEYDTEEFDGPTGTLIPQEGPFVRVQESLPVKEMIRTPKGETVIDFGQEVTGIVEFKITNAKAGDRIRLRFGEVLDKDGNFYNENYRGAKCLYEYTCTEGENTFRPHFTFYGFRYLRVDEFPGGVEKTDPACLKALVIHSDMKRTGWVTTGNPLINRFVENVFWGQKGNFVDIPTDCPQRDERLGWTGDAQAFIKTACMNFDCEKFWSKWLKDLAADQREDGMISHVCPEPVTKWNQPSAAWGDAAVICPMALYKAYGDKERLREQFPSMCKWIDYIGKATTTPYLWTGGEHYGDWLGLDSPQGTYKGVTREDFIASAFYAYSTSLVIEAGKILDCDVSGYENLYSHILAAFKDCFKEDFTTQTECVLAIHFRLTDRIQETADKLADMIRKNGNAMQTGFVGTPYLLYVLTENGYEDLAYKLLLREDYPSWLYPVKKGATTIWEHWDGIMEDGSFWSSDMNSFNHYAYGCVLDWIYTVSAGIRISECIVAPHPNKELGSMDCRIDSRKGTFISKWKTEGDRVHYEITVPVKSTLILKGKRIAAEPGTYAFTE